MNLKSKKGNVAVAFLHADLAQEEKVFVEITLGFRQRGKFLWIKKTLYGLRQSPCEFW